MTATASRTAKASRTRAGRTGVQRLTGMGPVASLALAALVFGCVLAATAGPRAALNARTRALSQTVRTFPAQAQTVSVSGDWNTFTSSDPAGANIAERDLSGLSAQFNADFDHGAVRMAPVAADWAAMTTTPQKTSLTSKGNPVKVELSLRVPDTGHLRVVEGNLDAPAPASGTDGFLRVINVAVTEQTATQFGLTIGSPIPTSGIPDAATGGNLPITYRVAAIAAQDQPSSSFWQDDPAFAAPVLNPAAPPLPSYWVAGAFALPSEIAAIQTDYGATTGLNLRWVLPLKLAGLTGDQAQPLAAELQKDLSQAPALRGPFAAAGTSLTVSASLQQMMASFLGTGASVDVLLWLVYASLAVTAAAALLLAARMIAARRSAEFTLRRARGASLPRVALDAGRGALVVCLPAAVLAGAVAVLLVPGPVPPGGWWPGLAILAVTITAPTAIAVWEQRFRRRRPGTVRRRRRFRGGVRLVAEVTLIAAAVAGLVVFRQQGPQQGGSVNLYTSTAPALVAIPAVIVLLRLYPLVLAILLRGAARGRGATGFIGLARAARSAFTPALPAYALVLAITVAAFTGMVRDAITRGEVTASWQSTGADVTVNYTASYLPVSAAAQHALAAVPGITRSAVVAEWAMAAPNGSQVTAVAVNPAAYAALVASGQSWPAVNPALLNGDGVLASPQALAAFGGKTATLTEDAGVAPLQVRVTGTLSGTPALAGKDPSPGGGAFVLMSDELAAHEPGVMPNVMLLNGPGIDTARAATLVSTMLPGADTFIRSDIVGSLTGAPVQQGAFGLLIFALVVAAGLGLAVMFLQLALGAADREATLARLATMGLSEGQRTRLVLLETLPAVFAAAIAAVACAQVLPRLLGPSIDLSVFTGSGASVPLTTDVASIAYPLAGLVAVAALTLAIEIRARRGVAATLRGGE